MSRDELESAWPLVVRHYDAVVQFLETPPTAKRRLVSRRGVLEDGCGTRDIRNIAAKHHVSPSVIEGILGRAVKVARACESGTPPHLPRPRRTLKMTLTDVPAALIREIDAWAHMRGHSRRDAACELLKLGLDATSIRAERQTEAAVRVRRARARHPRRSEK